MNEIAYQIEQALLALRDNKLRSLLSVLGLATGVAAVLLIAAVSEAGRSKLGD